MNISSFYSSYYAKIINLFKYIKSKLNDLLNNNLSVNDILNLKLFFNKKNHILKECANISCNSNFLIVKFYNPLFFKPFYRLLSSIKRYKISISSKKEIYITSNLNLSYSLSLSKEMHICINDFLIKSRLIVLNFKKCCRRLYGSNFDSSSELIKLRKLIILKKTELISFIPCS